VADAADGIDGQSGSGIIRDCQLVGRGSAGTGLKLGPGMSTTPADSTFPLPIKITKYSLGVDLISGCVARNIIAYRNSIGFINNSFSPNIELQYCTSVNNGSGIVMSANGVRILMAISALNGNDGIYYNGGGGSNCNISYFDYCDSWSNGNNYTIASCAAGPRRSSFNPFFESAGTDDYHLSGGSIFKSYGPWGAEIGAYGPGPGSPTPTTPVTWGRMKAAYR